MLAVPSPTLGRLPLPISLRSLSPILAAPLMPPRGLPTLVAPPPIASSSVTPLSSASFRGATAACRSLALAASPASRRSSALLAAREKKERKQTSEKKEKRKKTDKPRRGMGEEDRGPHLHEQDFGRTIRGTGGALLLLTRDTTGSQRGARWTPNSTGGLISV